MLHEKAASRKSKLEHENEVSETGLLKLSEVPSFWGHCQIWLLYKRDAKSCRTPFSLPLFRPSAKTQVFFFFLQTTHSLLYSCLPWFLTELPTLPTGLSNSCIRFFFLFFFVLLPRASRSWTQTRGQDFEGESHETTRITGGENGRRREGKKNKIWLSFHKPGGGAEPLELSYAPGRRSPLVEALVHETRTTVLILYTQYHQR